MARCLQCNGAGEIEHPAYRELERLWLKGFIFDEEGITDFWLNRGCNPANPPLRYTACEDCGGTGDMSIYENLALEARALAAWRAVNPEGLTGRLLALHQKNAELAHTLARYAGQYYGLDGELTGDVAAWPVREPTPCPSCLICGGRGMLDDIPC